MENEQGKASEKYNGWTNRETWAFNLWITNTEGDYNYWLEEAKGSESVSELAEKMKENLVELWDTLTETPEGTSREGRLMLKDIGDISEIDYFEVAKGFFDEAHEKEKVKE